MDDKTNEDVLVVATNRISEHLQQGFFLDNPTHPLLPILSEEAGWLRRDDAEKNFDYKQIIPYTIVRDVEHSNVLAYRRTTSQGESRLHDKWSIGFGGHLNPEDVHHRDGKMQCNYVWAGAVRELNEEVYVPGLISMHHIGFVNDDVNEVGEVHLGVVFQACTSSDAFAVNEPDKIQAEWMPRNRWNELLDGGYLESWSAYLLSYMSHWETRRTTTV